jgi:2-aminoethylphosphonate-pyruvate transaminase
MPKIDTAVFLAAGLGSRLKGLAENKPKGFLEIDGVALIERSVQNLLHAGIRNFIIGTGFLSDIYEDFASKYNAVCVRNDSFANTGSMFTLYNMLNHINNDFLLLEADLLYHSSGLEILIEDEHNDSILASGRTFSGDEVYVETDRESYLVNMSKSQSSLASVDAELVGITKISIPTFKKMCEVSAMLFPGNPKLDYEYALVAVSKNEKIYVKKVENYVWCEIDDETHYQRALSKIYPLLKQS